MSSPRDRLQHETPSVKQFVSTFSQHKVTFIIMWLAHLNVGFESILGNTLPYLAIRTQTTINVIGYALSARSLSFMMGAIISGVIYAPLGTRSKKLFYLATCLVLSGAACAGIPMIHSFILLCVFSGTIGASVGGMDTVHHILMVQLCNSHHLSRTFVFSLHLTTSIGAFLATIAVRIFLTELNESFLHEGYCTQHSSLPKSMAGHEHENDFAAVRWPFLIACLHNIIVGCLYTVSTAAEDTWSTKEPEPEQHELRKIHEEDGFLEVLPPLENEKDISFAEENSTQSDGDVLRLLRHPYCYLLFVGCQFFCIAATESVYWYELFSFGLCNKLHLSATTATTLEHIFFGGFITVRIIGVIFCHSLDPRNWLLVNLMGAALTNVLLAGFGNSSTGAIMILVTLAGITHATSIANLFNWSSDVLQGDTTYAPRLAGVTFFSVGLGFATSPPVTGHLFLTKPGAISIFYYTTALSFVNLILFFILKKLAKSRQVTSSS